MKIFKNTQKRDRPGQR